MSQTSDRYAQALFELAQQQDALQAVEDALCQIKALIKASVDFRSFLGNPLLSYDESRTVLRAIFEGKVPKLVFRFLTFITYKGRLIMLGDMIDSFDQRYLTATHQMRARVVTALPMPDAEKTFISQRLEDKFRQKVMAAWSVDPSLIGGFRIFAQDKLYDYSFKDELDGFLQGIT